jgi:hypothetical protein
VVVVLAGGQEEEVAGGTRARRGGEWIEAETGETTRRSNGGLSRGYNAELSGGIYLADCGYSLCAVCT